MKQKMVIKLQMEDEKKRRKAMKVAVQQSGVLSAAIEGADKNQIVVVGDCVDSVALTTALRKNMRFAELVSVAPVEEKKDDKKDDKKEDKKPETAVQPVVWFPPPTYYYVPDDHCQESSCITM